MENTKGQEIVPVEENEAFELVGDDKEIKYADDALNEETTALTAGGEKLATPAVNASEEIKSADLSEKILALTVAVAEEQPTTVRAGENIKSDDFNDEVTTLTAVVAGKKQVSTTVNVGEENKSSNSNEEMVAPTAVEVNEEPGTAVSTDKEIKLTDFNEETTTLTATIAGEGQVTTVTAGEEIRSTNFNDETGEEIRSTNFNDETLALTVVAEPQVTTVNIGEEIKSSDFNEEGAMALTVVTYEHQQEKTTASAVADEKMQEGTMVLTVASGGGEETVIGGDDVVAMASCGEFSAKRKRGRPKKESEEYSASAPPRKRTRGRPKGTGKNQRMAALGDALGGDTGGSHFTPRIITVHQGEDIAEKISSFCAATPDSVCILSASGTVSVADLKTPGPHPGVLRYQGELSIVTLMGSYTYPKKVGGKLGLLTAQLAYPDGRLFGGAVGGQLIAATPTQIALATFKQNMRQVQRGRKRPLHTSNEVTVAAVAETVSPMQPPGMRLLAVAERVDIATSDDMNQPVTYAQPIGWTPFASPI